MAKDALRTTFKRKAHLVNSKRVFRLIKQMGLMAIFPKPNLLKANKEYKIFPYLLRERTIDKVNEVWSTDISYIRMRQLSLPGGYIMDWHSPYVVSWHLSDT